jgi:hypothetical protein
LVKPELLEVFTVANLHILRDFRNGLRTRGRLSEGLIVGALILGADCTLNRVVRIYKLATDLLILKVLRSQFLVAACVPSLRD